MPVDYSKWDALELSDDSDIEVHPNVDKRSFIRAKQNQIHAERQQRRNQIETLKYERIINDTLIKRISALLASLKAHASDAKTKNPGEVAFRAVMESAAGLDPKDDQPPPRPAGVHNAEEQLPSYTKMMATLLDQVNKALDEKKLAQDERYDGMVAEIGEHLKKVTDLQGELIKKLGELEKEESRKITSEGLHTGFDSSHVNKSTSSLSGSGTKDSSKVELLNPSYAGTTSLPAASSSKPSDSTPNDDDDDEEITASPLAKKFALIKSTDYRESLAFLSQHPHIAAPSAATASPFLQAHQHAGPQAQEVFHKDVQDTYLRIRRAPARSSCSAPSGRGQGRRVEQIQLHAVEPGTVINIKVPPEVEAGSEDAEAKKAREIFEGFKPEMQKALETGKLDEVNKVLGEMKIDEAEELVGLLGEAGILSLEEEIIDTTTEEGKDRWKQIEEEKKAAQYADDPE
ncbi:hypothetical protein NEMBOFW57_000807 [Staphylotrichum longicolle]|uniref:Hsp90 chaperone protein kinase-targeting subunit n=1 Tax=Staphylotrichum longicolle TaxID=669026 RepID=A0AAD4F010_9PEZI|nr:hypothetical protein NEMBOFW57_000807 [Staphylotrichum longicolle]